MSKRTRRLRRGFAAAAVTGCTIAAAGIAFGSDHQDTPEVELNPKMDMTDVYAFPGSSPDRVVLVLNSRAFLTPGDTPGADFDPDLLYQFKVDTDGDAVENKVIQVTFTGEGDDQRIQVRGPVDPPVSGPMMNTVTEAAPAIEGALNTVLGDANGLQVFAGPRDDPFFIDLEAAFCILPDRKPVGGELSEPCALPTGAAFRSPEEAQNYVNGFNVLSIVVELPTAQLAAEGNPRIGVWGTISR